MKVLFITRATYLEGFGGDSIQIVSTAKYLKRLGVEVDVRLCNEKIDYEKYDLIHLFNIIRPADSLIHVLKSGKPYVISTIFLDYADYESKHRKGVLKWANQFLSKSAIEYIKAIGRYFKNGERIVSPQYWWLGHKKSIVKLCRGASLLLPNSHSEYKRLVNYLGFEKKHKVIYNGIDKELHFNPDRPVIEKDKNLVICVARIEGNKNQLNLIKALNNTNFKLKIIGNPAPNHMKYYRECKRAAASNIEFTGFISLNGLIENYRRAQVHILPSFNETCGLSSLEAAHHRCCLVITKGGDTMEYFKDEAFYCDPEDEASILQAVKNAANAYPSDELYQKTQSIYTWEAAAEQSFQAYRNVLNKFDEERQIKIPVAL